MAASDVIGWLAAGLTLLAFSTRSIVPLRLAAMAANVCFIVYGVLASLPPVVALHLLLLPCNALRLWQLSPLHGTRGQGATAVATPKPSRRAVPYDGRDWLIVSDTGRQRRDFAGRAA